MNQNQVVESMTEASPVTTIHGLAWLRHAVLVSRVVTGLAPVMFPHRLSCNYKHSNSYPNAYGHPFMDVSSRLWGRPLAGALASNLEAEGTPTACDTSDPYRCFRMNYKTILKR